MEDKSEHEDQDVGITESGEVPLDQPQTKADNIENPLIADRKISRLKKFIVILSIPLIVIFAAIYIVPVFIDWEAQRSALVKNIREVTGRRASIDGSISFSAFPKPSFSVKGLRVRNIESGENDYILQVENATAYPSLLSLIFGKIDINSVELDNATIDIENFKDEKPNWNFEAGRGKQDVEKSEELTDQYLNIDLIKINTAKLFFHSGNRKQPIERMMPLENIHIEADSFSGPFVIIGELKSNIGNLNAGFDLDTGNLSDEEPTEFLFHMYSGTSLFTMEGTVKNWTTHPYMEGKLKAGIDQSIRSLTDYFGIDESILPAGISAMLSNNKTEIAGDVFMSAKGADLKNISLNSASTKGRGSFAVTYGQVNQIDINLIFEYLDLDRLLADSETLQNTIESAQRRKELKIIEEFSSGQSITERPKFDLGKNLKLLMDISVLKAKYKDHEFSELAVKADMGMGSTIIHSLTAKELPGNTFLDVSGTLQKEQAARLARQQFQSKIKASGENLYELLNWLDIKLRGVNLNALGFFEIEGNIQFSPESMRITRIKLKSNDLDAVGQALVKYGEKENEKPVINSAFQFKKLDLDKYIEEDNVSEEDVDINEYQEIQDERRFDKLRNLNLYFRTIGIKIIAEELVYDEKSYKDVSTVLLLQPGKLDVKEFSVKSGDSGKIKGSISINAKTLRPSAVFTMEAESFALGVVAEDRSAVPEFSDKKFSFKRFGALDTEFSMKFKELSLGRMHLKKAELSGAIDKDTINFTKFRGFLAKGRLDVKAILGVRRASASASYSLANAEIGTLLKDWFDIDVVRKGKVSSSGTLSTLGLSIKSWMENLEGAGNMTSRGIDIKGFTLLGLSNRVDAIKEIDDLRAFIQKTLSVGKTNVDYLAGNFYTQSGITNFKELSLSQSLIRYGILNAKLDIPQWALNIDSSINLNLRNSKGNFAGAVPLSVNVSGTIDNLSTKWDTKGIEKHWESKFYGGS